jgi:acetyltransferase-like isoleucine patch superfamily enzyme
MTERRPPLDLSEEQLNYIVTRVNHAMLNEPRCWGPTKRVIVGQNVALANTLFNTSSGMVIIGDDSFFGHNVCLLTGTHDHHKRGVSRHESVPDSGRDILIGRGVWISSNVTVIGPCSIGDDVVIAAGSVVTGGELPGGYIYAGVPAKAIKAIDFTDPPATAGQP